MRTNVTVVDINCEDCRDKVLDCVKVLDGISNVEVITKTNTVSLEYASHNAMEGVRIALREIGFPIIQDPDRIEETKERKYLNVNAVKMINN